MITEMNEEELEKIEEQSMIDGYIALAKENEAFAKDTLPLVIEVLPEYKPT